MASQELQVLRAAEIHERSADEPRWLIEPLWAAGGVGIIGGSPKSCKTWLALEMAVAVASGRPCLGRFPVPRPGPALLFGAEDAPQQLKSRLQSLASARQADFHSLDVRLIVENSLRLDSAEDLQRLRRTLARHRPKLLILDPYVRLQRADENDVRQVSAILSALRELSRTFETAVALVHHARKNAAELPGQALRGSGDFWAWGDSNLYLSRRRDALLLTVEHRAAPSPPPLSLHLLAREHENPQTQSAVCLQVQEAAAPAEPASAATLRRRPPGTDLPQRILTHLAQSGHSRHRDLRCALRVRDKRLSEALRGLEAAGRVARTSQGWNLTAAPVSPGPLPHREREAGKPETTPHATSRPANTQESIPSLANSDRTPIK